MEELVQSWLVAQNWAMAGRILAVLLVSAFAAGCGGHKPRERRVETDKSPRAAPAIVGLPGRLVGIGGGRSLFLHCVGSGGPTVVLEAGAGGDSSNWRDVQPQLGRTTRTCAYDRAGVGNSVAPPGVRDARDEITDLRQLLARARIDPPYVLVGHSYGGVLARAFTQLHPTETAGLVLIDTMGRDGRRRQLAIWPKSQAPEIRGELATRVIDGVDLGPGEALASRVRTLPDSPLAVITAGRQDNFPRTPAQLARALERLWSRMQDELAGLSDNSVHVVALRSDHDVPSAHSGQPSVVVGAVQAVVRAARERNRLTPCRRIFNGADIRCRS
jgi:pimeloyl-ACP methyl ester carboxylesterase